MTDTKSLATWCKGVLYKESLILSKITLELGNIYDYTNAKPLCTYANNICLGESWMSACSYSGH